MGFLDRFKPKREQIGKGKKPKHVVDAKKKAAEEKRKQFAAVGSAEVKAKPAGEKSKDSGQAAEKKSAVKRREDSGIAYRVLLRAVVSEKSTAIGGLRQYVFAVADTANKIDVRQAIHSLYGLRPQKVNIINVAGKSLRYGRTSGRTKNWKKAIVTLQPGQTINVSGS